MANNNDDLDATIGFRCPNWLKVKLEGMAKKEKRSLSNFLYLFLAKNVADANETNTE